MSPTIPLSFSTFISSQHLSHYNSWKRISNLFFSNIKSFPFPLRSLLSLVPFPAPSLVYVATDTVLFLLHINQAETSSCSNCGSESLHIFHLLLNCPALDSLRLAIFSLSLSWTCSLVLGGDCSSIETPLC